MQRFNNISDLTDPACLCKITGPITGIKRTTLSAIGFSGSVLERVEVNLQTGGIKNLILKYTRLENDWLSLRSKDMVGREGSLLSEAGLSGVWHCIHSPYIAFACENDATGLLMDDFTDYLFPDIREPIDILQEDLILNTIASLHATFWESSEIRKMKWLMQPQKYLDVLGPGEHTSDKTAAPPDKVRTSIHDGWNLAFQLLPVEINYFLKKPADEIFQYWNDLPVTLLHGDAKIANMAILPSQQVVMFDWTYIGWGPCGIELGWWLAVNSTRLARSKEDLISQYRFCLQSNLSFFIPEKTWTRMIQLAIVTGVMMMLWSKALGFRTATKRGIDEWEWWVTQLKTIVSTLRN